jgi:hypothetical protein
MSGLPLFSRIEFDKHIQVWEVVTLGVKRSASLVNTVSAKTLIRQRNSCNSGHGTAHMTLRLVTFPVTTPLTAGARLRLVLVVAGGSAATSASSAFFLHMFTMRTEARVGLVALAMVDCDGSGRRWSLVGHWVGNLDFELR